MNQRLIQLARPVLGVAAPALRATLRRIPAGPRKVAFWRAFGRFVAPGSKRFTVPTNHGFLISGDTEDLVTRYIYHFGVWEPGITALLERSLQCGDTFIDVGTHVGYYTLLASGLVGDAGRVVSFEASPKTFELLRRNLERNHVRNVRAVNLAISDREESLELFALRGADRGVTTTLRHEGYISEGSVPAKPLPLAVTADELESARFVKIDVEGAEWKVVSGLGPALSRTRHDAEVIVEVSPERLRQVGKRAEDVFSLFADAGFKPYAIENDYSGTEYVSGRRPEPPRRLVAPLTRHCDIVFSRRDVAEL